MGTIANIKAVASLGLYLYAILAPVWALWLGISLLRNPVQIQTA